MTKLFLILFFVTPLLACTAEASNSNQTLVMQHISTIVSGKSNRADRQYWRGLLNWSNECEEGFQYPESVSGIDIYPMNDSDYIIRVTCTLGAYQGYQQFYRLSLAGDKAKVTALLFPLYEVINKHVIKNKPAADICGNVLNNADYKNFTVLNQYSGYGNCGTLTTYKITDDTVTATKFRAAPDCESKTSSRDPDKWTEYRIA